jgi:hypothetical protein
LLLCMARGVSLPIPSAYAIISTYNSKYLIIIYVSTTSILNLYYYMSIHFSFRAVTESFFRLKKCHGWYAGSAKRTRVVEVTVYSPPFWRPKQVSDRIEVFNTYNIYKYTITSHVKYIILIKMYFYFYVLESGLFQYRRNISVCRGQHLSND